MGWRSSKRLGLTACASMVLASIATIGGPAAHAAAPEMTRLLAPNHLVRAHAGGNAGGIAATGWTSSNWSGYAVTSGAPYTKVTAVWIVPKAAPTSTASFSAAWIGIDGFNNSSLIQAGTEEDYYLGAAHYTAWWTTSDFGFLEQQIPTLTVRPGDLMLSVIGQSSPGIWTIILIDATSKTSFAKSVAYSGPGASAEWILEAPTVGNQVAQLAHYGATIFDAATVNGAAPGFVANDGGVLLQGGVGVSTPSVPDTEPPPALSDGFSIAHSATAPPPPAS